MPRLKLTKTAVARLPAPDPSGKQVLHWDAELRGFAVLCSGTTNTKSYIVQRDLAGGKTRRVTIGPTNVLNLEDARRRAEGILGQMYQGVDPKAEARAKAQAAKTLADTLEDYLASARGKRLRPKSVLDYRSSVEKYLASWAGLRMADITPDMVEARHRAIAREVAARGRGTGEATANGVFRCFRALHSFAAEHTPGLPPNPVRRLSVTGWFDDVRREEWVQPSDLPRFVAAVQGLPNPIARDYIMVLLLTGMRMTECATLTWDDVDFQTRAIRVPGVRTKNRRALDLPMTTWVQSILVARRAIGSEKYVFAADSRAGHIAEPRFPLELVEKATGLHVRCHDLRRTYATIAEATEGVSPLALKALLNHAVERKEVTSGYIQMTLDRLRGPAQRVADEVARLAGLGLPAGDNIAVISR